MYSSTRRTCGGTASFASRSSRWLNVCGLAYRNATRTVSSSSRSTGVGSGSAVTSNCPAKNRIRRQRFCTCGWFRSTAASNSSLPLGRFTLAGHGRQQAEAVSLRIVDDDAEIGGAVDKREVLKLDQVSLSPGVWTIYDLDPARAEPVQESVPELFGIGSL